VPVDMMPSPAAGTAFFTKLMESFKVPGVDMTTLMAAQQKNMEAFTKATQITTAAATAISRRQTEIMQASVEQAVAMLKDMKVPGKSHADIIQKAFDTALANARELAEMTMKANADAYEVVKGRMKESMEELRKTASNTTT
jgi:phasin family protein